MKVVFPIFHLNHGMIVFLFKAYSYDWKKGLFKYFIVQITSNLMFLGLFHDLSLKKNWIEKLLLHMTTLLNLYCMLLVRLKGEFILKYKVKTLE